MAAVHRVLVQNRCGTIEVAVFDAPVSLHLCNIAEDGEGEYVVHGGRLDPTKPQAGNEAASLDVLVDGGLHDDLVRNSVADDDAEVLGLESDFWLQPERGERQTTAGGSARGRGYEKGERVGPSSS